jgi:hypothetical protein
MSDLQKTPSNMTSSDRTLARIASTGALLLLAVVALARFSPPALCQSSPTRNASGAGAARITGVRVGVGNTARVGTWTPVVVDITADGSAAFAGELVVTAPDDDGTAVESRQPIQLDPGSRQTVEVYVRLGRADGEVLAHLTPPGHRVGDALGPPVRAASPPRVLSGEDRVILSLGQTHGLDDVVDLVTRASTSTDAPGRLIVVRPGLDPGASGSGGLPGRWFGLDLASTLVLDVNDPAVRTALPTHAGLIAGWVQNGGHLVVTGAQSGSAAAESLGELLPARATGMTRLNDLGAIEAYAGSTTNPIRANAMDVARLELPGMRPGVPPSIILGGSGELPLILRAARGFGRVTLIGLDVDRAPFSEWKDRPLFWSRALDVRTPSGPSSADGSAEPAADLFGAAESADLAGSLHSLLDQPPGVRSLSFGWVAFFVFLYIALIGPIDYLFLRRVARRMELTWLTFPALVAATTAAAYFAAYSTKGRDLRAVKLDAIDIDVPTRLVRGQSFVTLYSPSNRDYGLSVQPLDVSATATAERWLAPADEAADDATIAIPSAISAETLVSWFGPPVPRFGGGGGAGALAPMTRPYGYGPPGRLDALGPVRVPIWSTKSFEARWSGQGPDTDSPMVEAELVATGSNRIEGRLTNHGARPLERATLFFGDVVYDQLGTIPPGGSVVIDVSSRTRPVSGYLEERARGVLNADGQLRDVSRDTPAARTRRLGDLVRTMLFRDSMNARTRTPPSEPLRHLDLTGQLALGRPMLVADIDGPAVAVRLTGAHAEPKVVERTVVRMILALQGETP